MDPYGYFWRFFEATRVIGKNWPESEAKPNYQVKLVDSYRVFHGFGQAKFADGGSILGSSRFTQTPQLSITRILMNTG